MHSKISHAQTFLLLLLTLLKMLDTMRVVRCVFVMFLSSWYFPRTFKNKLRLLARCSYHAAERLGKEEA